MMVTATGIYKQALPALGHSPAASPNPQNPTQTLKTRANPQNPHEPAWTRTDPQNPGAFCGPA